MWTGAGLVLAGLSTAAPTVALTKSIARAFESTRRLGVAIGIRQASVPLGGSLAGIVLPLVALRWGLAWSLWALALCLGVAAVIVSRAIRPTTAVHPRVRPGPTPWSTIAPMLAASALYTFVQMGVISLLTLYLVNLRGWGPAPAAMVFAGVMTSTIVLRIVVGLAADRWSHLRRRMFRVSGLLTAALLVLAALANPAPVAVPMIVAAAIIGMGWNTLAFTLTVSAVPQDRVGTSQGVLNALIFASWGVSPIITSAFVQALSWSAAWLMLAGCALLGAYFAGMRRRRFPETPGNPIPSRSQVSRHDGTTFPRT